MVVATDRSSQKNNGLIGVGVLEEPGNGAVRFLLTSPYVLRLSDLFPLSRERNQGRGTNGLLSGQGCLGLNRRCNTFGRVEMRDDTFGDMQKGKRHECYQRQGAEPKQGTKQPLKSDSR